MTLASNRHLAGKRKIASSDLLVLCFCLLAFFSAAPAVLAAPVPTVSLAVSTTTPFIGNSFTITASFDNTGPAGDTGYGPFIDLVFPSRGADGDPGTGEPVDGISFGSATYMGAPVNNFYTLTFPDADGGGPGTTGCVAHPLAVDNTGAPVQVCGQAGDTLVVVAQPFGSFVTDQPQADVIFTANVSNMADVGTSLTFRSRAGFQFGADALNNPATDPSILSQPSTNSTTWAPIQAVTPQVVTVQKTSASGLTGDNFHRQYAITIQIAPGQTVDTVTVTDTLPSDMVYLGVTAAGGVIADQPALDAIVNPADNQLVVTYASLAGGTHAITVDFFVPEADYGGTAVIDRDQADDATSDPNSVSVQHTWTTPTDPRDSGGTSTITVNNITRTDMSMILDKAVTVVGGGPVIPGAILQHTLTIGVSDYFAFENLVIDDTINDGHRFLTGGVYTPELALDEHRGDSASADMNAANYTVTNNWSGTGGSVDDGDGSAALPTDGTTDFQFRLSDELITRGFDGKVLGGCVPAGGTGAGNPANCGCTAAGGCGAPPTATPPTVTLVYYTQIQQYFSDFYPLGNSAVDQGDILDNTATATGDVLNVTNLAPYGVTFTEQDDAAVNVAIGVGTLGKALYAINGVVPPPVGATIEPGDEVTYQITYQLPTHNFENLFLTDYLPLPVFSATEVASFVDGPASAAVPAPGTAKFGPSDTFRAFLVANSLTLPDTPGPDVYPVLATSGPQNTVTFTYGDYNDTLDSPVTIDILFTVTVTTDPYANGLLLTNQSAASESSTAGTTTATSAIKQIILDEPELPIIKSIVSSSNPGGVITDGNITNADAGDVLTFTITSVNTGDAPAYDVTFREPAVAGLSSCAVSSVVVNGAGVPYSGDMFGAAPPYLVLTNPVPGGDTVVVTYTCTLDGTVNPRDLITNTAYLNWAAGPGAPQFGEVSDDATITIGDPAIAKSVFAIVPGPSAPNVTTGDVVTYQLNVTIPEGAAPGLTITDTLPAGFEYVAGTVALSSIGSGVTLTNNPPTVGGTAQAPIFQFGNVTVTGTGGSANNTFVLTYNALVRDLPANSGIPLQTKTNTAALDFTGNPGGAITDSETLSFGEPQLSISKAVSPNTNLQAGTQLTFTLTVTNSGTAPAFDVVVTDVLNEGVNNDLVDLATVAALSTPAGYTYGYASPTVTYTQNNGTSLAAGASVVFTFTANVRADVVLGSSTYSNTAAVTGDSQEDVVADDRDTSGTSPVVTVSMRNPAIAKTIAATSEAWTATPDVAIGEVITYQIACTLYQGVTLTQAGAAILRDTLPAGQQYLAGTATIRGVYNTGISGSIYGPLPAVATAIAPTVVGQALRFDLGNLTNSDNDADTEQVIIQFNALVLNTSDNNRAQTKTNTGGIYYRNRAGTNQSRTDTENVVINEPNLTATKTPDVTTASGGDTITFTVVVTNANNTNVTRAWELTLTDALPSPDYGSPALVSAILSRGALDITACGGFTGNTLNLDMSCMPLATDRYLAPGDTVTLVYTAVLDPNIAFEAVTNNTVSVQTTSLPGTNGNYPAPGAPDSDTGERTGSNALNTSGQAVNDLNASDNATVTADRPTITKVVSDNTLQILETTTTTLTIPIPVGQTSNFVVTDDLPPGLSYTGTAISITLPAGVTSTAIPPIPAPAAGTDPLVFNFGTIQNSGAATLNLVIAYEVQVDNVIGNQNLTSLQNTASLSYTGVTLPVPSDSDTITVIEPNVTATKIITAGAAGSNAGDTVSYQSTISNTDPNGTAYQVNLRDVLPAHLLGANSGVSPFFTNIVITNPGGAVVLNSDGVTPLNSGHAAFAMTSVADDTLTWPLFDMPPTATLTITYDVVVTDNAIVGETLTNTVTAVYDSRSDGTGRDNADNPLFDGSGLNNYGVRTTRALTLDASIALQKTLAAGQPDDRFSIGEEVMFDLRVDVLTGVTQTVVVTDVLPSGLDFIGLDTIEADTNISYTGPGTAAEAPVGTITVNMNNVTNDPDANPANDYFIVRLRTKVQNVVANQNGITLTDTGSVASALNSASDTLDVVVVEPALSVTKVADTTAPPLGGTVTYTVTVRHNPVIGTPPGSSSDAYDVTLTDLIPAGLTYVAGSFSGSGAVDDSALPTLGVNLGSITMAEISKTFSYQVTVDNDAVVGSALTNTVNGVYASIPGANGDPDDGRNGEDGAAGLNNYVFSVTEDVTPATPAFVRAPKTVAIAVDGGTAGQLDPGDTLEYTIVLDNSGVSQASNVVFTDAIPANTTYVAASLTTTQGAIVPGFPLQVNVGTMNAGATVTITFRVTVNALTPDGTVISNQGLVDSDETVPRPTDDDDIDANGLNPTDIIVGPRPSLLNSLYVEKRVMWMADNDSSGSVTPGDRLTYTLIADNLGSASLTGINITDTIPAGLTYVGGTLLVTQDTPPGSAAIAGQALTWPVGTLAAGSWAAAVFDVTINAPLPGSVNTYTFTNQGSADSNETTPIPTDGNGNPSDGYQPTSITAVDGIPGSPDLDVQKRYTVAVDNGGDGYASPGDTLEYQIFITNSGSSPLHDVRIDDDPIPANTTIVVGSVYTSQGVVLDEDPVTVNIGTVDPGDVITVRFQVLIGPNPPVVDGTIISNQANVTSTELPDELSDDNGIPGDGVNPDPTLTPVRVGASTVGAPTDLTKSLFEIDTSESGSALPAVFIGEVMTYQVSVTMPEGLLRQATLLDTLSAGLTYVGNAELARVFNTGITAATNPGNVNTAASTVFVPVTLTQSGQDLSLILGDVINSDSDVGAEGYVLRYDVLVANIASNQAGITNTNSATLTYLNSLGAGQTLLPTSLPVTVTVAEPAIGITLSADLAEVPAFGGTVTFTLVVTNPGGANVGTGYDVQITDLLPAGYSNLVVIAITPAGGVLAGDITDSSTSAGLDVMVDTFPANGVLTIVFMADAGPAGTAPNLTNTADAVWTSVPGLNGTGGVTPGVPGSSTGERNGDDGIGGALNDYMASDNATVNYEPARRAIKCVSSCTACNNTCAPVPQFATVPDSASLDLTTTGTIEAWIQATSCTTSDTDAGIVTKGATAATCYGFGLAGGTLFPGGTAQNIGFRLGADVLTATSHTLVAGKWYHVACVWDAATMSIYINGVLENSGPVTGGGAPVSADALILGRQSITATPVQYFGVIEEFRLWSTARTQAEIRDNMCRTLTLPDGDLACYLQYNEYGGTVAGDASGNANDADTTNVSQVCSEAPLGDASDHDYYDETATYQVFIAAGSDTMAADDFTGTWNAASKSGIHIYQVSDTPEPSTGPMETRLFTSRGYWGVFVTGGVDPTYSVTYTYGAAGIGDENNLDLAYRHQGCAPWIDLDAVLNTGASTLTQTGLEGTEFILGSLVDPRNTIDYDGVNDVVTVPDDNVTNTLDLSAAGTLEAWVYIDNHTPNGGIIHKGDNTDLTDEAYSLNLGPASNTIVFTVRDGVGADTVTSVTVLNTDTWYHVAGVWDDGAANSMQIYINGVADGAPGVTRTARNSGGGLNIGQQFTVGALTYEPFDGYIDEVRVWDTARTLVQLQTFMCQKLTGTEANLQGYWRFDDETILTNCPDYTVNNNDGAMSGTFADVRAARICSSAPIGDYSAYNYGAGASTVTLNPTGDPFSATASGGIWAAGSGIHVYRLDEAPVYGPDLWITAPYTYTTPNGLTPPVNASAPPPNWSSIDYYRYWGVFVTDPTSGVNQPVYDVVYNYNGNPMTPQNDATLGLARRDGFCDRTWVDPGASVTLNTVANTLTFSGDIQNAPPAVPPGSKQNPEYILGGKDDPLAITLAAFTATAVEGCVDIAWETATEINTAGFYVWRSDNPLTGFVRLDNSFVPSKSVAETMGAKYAFRDCGVDFNGGKTYYYMIEEIEIDGDGSGNMNGPIGPVSETISAAQSTSGSNGSNCFIDSLGLW